jgi:hypothetical protein
LLGPGTPTVTYKLQGSAVDSPASTDWVDVAMIDSNADTAVTTKVVTAVGRYYVFLSQQQSRFFTRLRLVTSANTNVTHLLRESGHRHRRSVT